VPGSPGPRCGFRNREALDTARIVAIGDSQTWGVNASIDEIWPSQLGQLSMASTHTMGRGGYAMPQYVTLLRKGLALEPDLIVVALYSGNDDPWEAYRTVYGLPHWAKWRLPEASGLDLSNDPTAAAAAHHLASAARTYEGAAFVHAADHLGPSGA